MAGSTENRRSSYRIKGFRGFNKLHHYVPIEHKVPKKRSENLSYDYFWFVMNDTVRNASA